MDSYDEILQIKYILSIIKKKKKVNKRLGWNDVYCHKSHLDDF